MCLCLLQFIMPNPYGGKGLPRYLKQPQQPEPQFVQANQEAVAVPAPAPTVA